MAAMQYTEETNETAPRIRERGHLSLVEWNVDPPTQAPARKLTPSAHRTPVDRLYEGGIVLLMLATALAALASFARL